MHTKDYKQNAFVLKGGISVVLTTLEFISLEKELWSSQENRNYSRYFKYEEFNRGIGFTKDEKDEKPMRDGGAH